MKLMWSRKARQRRGERGVTMILIALAMVSLLAMAALAIDITTLYVAQGEAQNAADAAALAGARMFVSSGFTSVQAAALPPVVLTDVCQTGGAGNTAAANRQAEAAAAQNKVSGQAAAVDQITCDFSQPLNPRITVTIQRTALPTFFARIWNRASSTVTATATAEAYNASGLGAPVQPDSVKPWLVPNCTPSGTGTPNTNCGNPGNPFYVDPTNGTIANNSAFIGQVLTLTRVSGNNGPTANSFYAMNIPVSPDTPVCPGTAATACDDVGSDDYLDNIACASRYKFSCGQTIGPGNDVTVLTDAGYGAKTRSGVRCLIHADSNTNGLGNGQDQFTPSGAGVAPVTTNPGYNNPNPTLAADDTLNISRSDSIVTIPLYDGRRLCFGFPPGNCTANATIVGFLQLGITDTLPGPGHMRGVVLNAIGCNPGASGNPVVGNGASPIPVRLIHN